MASIIEIKVPDIGDFKDVPVIEVLVKPGDAVAAEQALVTLESDKATVEVPTPVAGTVKEVKLKVGDKVSEGAVVLMLEQSEVTEAKAAAAPVKPAEAPQVPPPQSAPPPPPTPAAATSRPSPYATEKETVPENAQLPEQPFAESTAAVGGRQPHASPSVRALARELGVDLARVAGSGPKNRITAEDIKGHVKRILSGGAGAAAPAGGFNVLPWPKIDFAKFGPVETQPLSRIQKLAGANLARNWIMIPHVTQFDAADITELEAHRVESNQLTEKEGVKLTMLAFLIKACVQMLKQFPAFNASLDGETLVLKRYYHIGFAADTPQGLVVPVIRDADKKSIFDIAREAAALAKKAREGKLGPAEMQGGCFSISSLGGIGGTSFTPIINAPEVAILGVSKSEIQPRWNGKGFEPRLMLPLSLSYDHRVIDGAAAARFTTHLAALLAETGKLLA